MTTTLQAPVLPMWPPEWAEVFGGDRFGMFAEFTVDGVGFVMRWVPPGVFIMGSPDDEAGRADHEGPQHRVTISAGFWLGETPVTQAQYEAVTGSNPSHFKGASRPVEEVSWHEAVAFCDILGERTPGLVVGLPSEAQWEYACRAGTTAAFHNGKACTEPFSLDPALDEVGWFGDNSEGKTQPVKQKRANEWGLYDLHGNVWEWCLDGWRTYTEGEQLDPLGSQEDGVARVVRGGSWHSPASRCRSAYRNGWDPEFLLRNRGFRFLAGRAKPPPEAPAEPVRGNVLRR